MSRARLRVFLVLAVLLGAAVAFASQELRCAVCGKPISGRYVEEAGRTYHESCYLEHRAERCAVCGKPILGPRIEFQGKSYHEECYREAKQPRCAACGKPIEGTYLVVDGKSYHPACRSSREPRCAVCGEPLGDSYLEDGWGNAFHARHGLKALCPFCGRVMSDSTSGGSFVSTANGIRICGFCARRAVSRREEVGPILERVRRRLLEIFPVPPESFQWELVDKRGLMENLPSGSTLGNELGFTRGDRLRVGKVVTRKIRVYLLSGIPDWLMEGVAAHELNHVWQQLEGLDALPAQQAEGAAEFASFLLLEEGGTAEGRVKIEAMRKSRDAIYGAGFRRALRAADSGQSPARLRKILETGRGWPSSP